MANIFLLVIYLALFSLGFPDTLLGSAWTVMQPDLGAPLEAAGVITLVVSCATILSCLLTERTVRLLGTSKTTVITLFVNAGALLGYSLSPSYGWLLLFAIPLGLGNGSVDTAIHNYAALHLSTRHVSWLQACYALGASSGPLLMSFVIGKGQNWRTGYLTISLILFGVAIFTLLTLPVWKGRDYKDEPHLSISESDQTDSAQKQTAAKKRRPLFRIPGVAIALLSYAVFFAIQYGVGLWAPSYLVNYRSFSPETAARAASIFYACVMVGRFVSGIISEKLSDKVLIRIGAGFCIAGTFCMGLPLPHTLYYIALACIGLGCAPIFPSMIHLTPTRFGREESYRVMGVQMAAAYAGSVLISPCIGFIAARVGVLTIPWLLFALSILIIFLSEYVDRIIARHPRVEQEPVS